MTSFISFSEFVEIQILLSVGLLSYVTLVKRSNAFTFQRFYLLATIGTSLSIPWWPQVESTLAVPTQIIQTVTIAPNNVANTIQNSFYFSFSEVYWSIALMLFIWMVLKIALLLFRLSQKRVKGSFSFFHIIQIDENLNPKDKQLVTQHELAHAQQWHSIDLIIVEFVSIVFWINPFVWILKSELKQVHEYLADATVLRNTSVDAKDDYAKLLLAQQFNISSSFFVQGFSEPSIVSKRIKKMYQKKSHNVTKIALTIALTIFTSTAALIACNFKQDSMPIVQEIQVEKNLKELSTQPEFPGGMDGLISYLSNHIKYPKSAEKSGIEGKVFVQFVIDINGNITKTKVIKSLSDDLDEVAVTAINEMPQWTPGEKDGKVVNVQFVLPIMFKLQSK